MTLKAVLCRLFGCPRSHGKESFYLRRELEEKIGQQKVVAREQRRAAGSVERELRYGLGDPLRLASRIIERTAGKKKDEVG